MAEWRGRKLGTIGDLGCFSFQNFKRSFSKVRLDKYCQELNYPGNDQLCKQAVWIGQNLNLGLLSLCVFVESLEKHTGNWYHFINDLAGFAVVWLILWWMYRKKTFIKI